VLVFISAYSFGQADYIFKNVNIIPMNGNKVLKNQSLTVKDGKIVDIEKNIKIKAKIIIDAKRKYLMPGLSDAHIHFPNNQEEFEKMLKLNLINGITKIRSMRGKWDDLELRKKFNAANSYYPKLYLSPPAMHRSFNMTSEELEQYVKSAKDNGMDYIKILSIKNGDMLKTLSNLCIQYNIMLGGHFPSSKENSEFTDSLIFSKNFKFIEHLGGLIDEPEFYESRINTIKKNNIFICPTLQWYAISYGQYGIDEMLHQRGMEYIPKEISSD